MTSRRPLLIPSLHCAQNSKARLGRPLHRSATGTSPNWARGLVLANTSSTNPIGIIVIATTTIMIGGASGGVSFHFFSSNYSTPLAQGCVVHATALCGTVCKEQFLLRKLYIGTFGTCARAITNLSGATAAAAAVLSNRSLPS